MKLFYLVTIQGLFLAGAANAQYSSESLSDHTISIVESNPINQSDKITLIVNSETGMASIKRQDQLIVESISLSELASKLGSTTESTPILSGLGGQYLQFAQFLSAISGIRHAMDGVLLTSPQGIASVATFTFCTWAANRVMDRVQASCQRIDQSNINQILQSIGQPEKAWDIKYVLNPMVKLDDFEATLIGGNNP